MTNARLPLCGVAAPPAEDEDETYAPRLQAWADAFPADQLFVLQVGKLLCPVF